MNRFIKVITPINYNFILKLDKQSNEIKNKFVEDGYYHAKQVYNTIEISTLEFEFDRVVDQLLKSKEDIDATWNRTENAEQIILHTHNVQQYSAEWSRAFFKPEFLEITKSIMGEDIILHHSKLFLKPALCGSSFPIHQDWSYFPTINDTMVAAVIFVTDANDEMGSLRIYPGSQKLVRLKDSSGYVQNPILDKYPFDKAVPIEARAGDVLFFSYFLLHGSGQNNSSRDRKSVLVQMHSGDDRVEDENSHPNENLVLSGWNHFTTRSIANKKSTI